LGEEADFCHILTSPSPMVILCTVRLVCTHEVYPRAVCVVRLLSYRAAADCVLQPDQLYSLRGTN